MKKAPIYIAKAKVNYHRSITWEWICLTKSPTGNKVWSTTTNKDRVETTNRKTLHAAADYLGAYSWFLEYRIRQVVVL